MKRLTMCCLVVALECVGAAARAEPPARLEVTVDPRMELLATVQLLSGYAERRGLINKYDFAYRRDVEHYFASFKGHPAVKTFAEMERRGFSHDAPPTAMLHLSDPPELEVARPFTDYLARRAGGRQRLRKFVAELRDFAAETDFMTFFRANRGSLEHMVRAVTEKTGKTDYLTALEEYYGTRQHGYHVILAPLFRGSYGPRLEREDGSLDVYSIVEPTALRDGEPVFVRGEGLRHLVWHEFGHSFVNPVTEKHSGDIGQYASLFKPIAESMKQQAYGNWKICVNEHLVRAAQVRLTGKVLGGDAAEAVLQQQKARGFAYVEPLCERLEEYEANRAEYPTFESFYPRLLDVFETLARKEPEELRAATLPNINSVVGNRESAVIVVPTNEPNDDTERDIHRHARAIADMFFKGRPVITDREALERDLSSNSLIIYGTPSGNRWLAKHLGDLPVRIEPDRIVADREYRGKNLRFITAWPNPDNAGRGAVIYTAQTPEAVVGINAVFHGPTHWVVARGRQVLQAGNYVRKDGRWTFK